MKAISNIAASVSAFCDGSFPSNIAIDTKVSSKNRVAHGFTIIFMIGVGMVAQGNQGSDVPEAFSMFLDNHCVGCHMGDANIHNNSNLPIILAGGGFRHGQHLAFNSQNNTPLCNVFVSMLQKMGIKTDGFASSTGKLTGLV